MKESDGVRRSMESWTRSGEHGTYRMRSSGPALRLSHRRRRPRAFLSGALAVAVGTLTTTASASSGVVARNQTFAVRPDSPLSRLPWVILTPNDLSVTGRVDGDVTCLGLLVSRSAALMAASCVEQYRETHNHTSLDSVGSVAVALGHESDVEVADLTSTNESPWHWRWRESARVVIHPKYETEPLTHDFALVRWSEAIDTQESVVLGSSGQLLEDDDRIATMVGAEEEYEATVRPSRSAVCPIGGDCVELTWEKDVSCLNLKRHSGVVYRSREDRPIVSGLVAHPLDCRESDAPSSSPTYSYSTVASLANARSFIDATIHDAKWMDSFGVQQGSGFDDTDVVVQLPPSQDGSQGGVGAASRNEDGGDVGFVSEPMPPVEVWRPNLQDKYGYLSRYGDLPDDAQRLVDGGIAVIIAPQFVLTRASWVRGLEQVEWVYFASQVIRIKRVVSRDADDIQDLADRLVVVELEHAIDTTDLSVPEIPTTLPPKYKDVRALSTAAFAGSSFVSTEYNALDDRTLCGLPEETTDELVCVTGSERANVYAKFLPFNASFLLMDQFLVGLSRHPSTTTSDLRIVQAFEPLGTSRTVRSFLEEATNGTVVWTEKDVYTAPPDQFIFGETVLYSNGTTLEDSLLPCGVVPLTRRFFLTMASCLGGRNVAWVVYHPAEDVSVDQGDIVDLSASTNYNFNQKHDTKQTKENDTKGMTEQKKKPAQHHHSDTNKSPRYPSSDPSWRPKNAIAVTAVYLHPIYEASLSPMYDFAIIECEQEIDVGGFTTVRLMGDALAPHARVVEHRLGSDSSDDEASLVVDAGECANATANGAVCVIATSSSPRCHAETEALTRTELLRGDTQTTQSLFYRVGYEVLFVGFFRAHAANSDACDTRHSYSQVINILNFVNAVVVGPEWGTSKVENSAVDFKEPAQGLIPYMPTQVRRPYVVGLRLTMDGQNFCGGSLIAPQFVLTAAHCVTDGLAAWVAVGSSVSSGLDSQPIRIDKARTRIHPQYKSPFAYSHDAAIIELDMPAYETAIALDTSPDFRDGAPATMFGYGVESASSTVLSPVLHARSLALLSRKTCATTLPNIDDAVVCALAPSGLDACTGDSGSPLVVADESAPGGERLVGVVSAGYGCGVAGVPGLYTRVASIAEFVDAYAVSPIWVGTGGGRGESEAIDDEPRTRPPSPTPAVTSSSVPGGSTRKPGAATGGTPASGDSDSQSTTDVSQLPLEDRNGNPIDSTSPGSAVPSVLAPANATGSSTFVAAIRRTPLPEDTFTALTKAKLLQFLLGDYSYSFVTPQLLDALASPANAVTFFSSGDVRPLLAVLAAHDMLPLSQRRDRFLSASRLREPRTVSSQCATATAH